MSIIQKSNERLQQRHALFWEVSPNRIKDVLRESDDWVVVRVFEYGEIQDIFDIIELYGEEKVKNILQRERLKPMAAVMAYLFLDIDRYKKYAS